MASVRSTMRTLRHDSQVATLARPGPSGPASTANTTLVRPKYCAPADGATGRSDCSGLICASAAHHVVAQAHAHLSLVLSPLRATSAEGYPLLTASRPKRVLLMSIEGRDDRGWIAHVVGTVCRLPQLGCDRSSHTRRQRVPPHGVHPLRDDAHASTVFQPLHVKQA